MKRRTHCIRGHEFTEANTYWPPSRPGERYCLTCKKERAHNHLKPRKAPRSVVCLECKTVLPGDPEQRCDAMVGRNRG